MIEYYLSKLIKKLHLRAIKDSKIHKTAHVNTNSHLQNVTIGRYTDIGYDNRLINTDIGSFCSFGTNVVAGGASHTIDWVSTSPVFNQNKDSIKKKFSYHVFHPFVQTNIGNDVWIGDHVLIKAGVTVGDGAVIGMGSVVTKNIPPYEIWAGNPAKLIKKRFSDHLIKQLLNIQWWNWDDNTLSEYAAYFTDVESFIMHATNKNGKN